jgi:hypothetical protein
MPKTGANEEAIIRAEKCRNSRENDSPLFPNPKKTPFRRSSYLATIRRPAKTSRKRRIPVPKRKRTQRDIPKEINA